MMDGVSVHGTVIVTRYVNWRDDILSQYPPAGGPGSTYYQLIEAMACLTLAATGAGRFAGLDSLIHARLFPADDNSTKG